MSYGLVRQQESSACRRVRTRAYAHNETHLCDSRRALINYNQLNYNGLPYKMGGGKTQPLPPMLHSIGAY